MLKGGFALDLRLAAWAQSTKDVDIEWRAGEDELADTLLDTAEHDAGDFFVLSVERTGTPTDRLGGAHRFRVSASLGADPSRLSSSTSACGPKMRPVSRPFGRTTSSPSPDRPRQLSAAG